MLRLTRHPAIWFTALLFWFGLLWFLSSLEGSNQPQPLPHFDKFAHFSYFFGGGLLFAGWRFRLCPNLPAWGKIIGAAVITMALIGWTDEWHQCFTPGRSGTDPWDWFADVIGSASGAFALKRFISE